jgi:hypothetical protein
MRVLPALKSELEVNIELVSPADFVPRPPGWEQRRVHIGRAAVEAMVRWPER